MKIKYMNILLIVAATLMLFIPQTADAQDVNVVVAGQNVNVDIDKMYAKWMDGSAIEFASGYEGVGKSGSSGFYAFYRINATSVDLNNSTSQVGTSYRYVP